MSKITALKTRLKKFTPAALGPMGVQACAHCTLARLVLCDLGQDQGK